MGRIVLIYALFAAIWIVVSDRLLIWAVSDPETLGWLALAKGWFFVMITSGLLYSLLSLDRRRLEQAVAVRSVISRALVDTSLHQQWLEDNIPGSYIYQYTRAKDGRPVFLRVSAGVEKLHLVTVAAVLQDAQAIHSQIAPEQWDALLAAERESLRSMSDFDQHMRILRPDGQSRWLHVCSRPRLRPDGQVVWDGLATDVTEQRQAAEALRLSEERLRIVTGSARVGLVMVDAEHRYIFANATYAEILDLPSADLVGRRVGEVLVGVYEEQIRPRLDRAFAGERVTYQLHRTLGDNDRHYAVNYEPARAGGQVYAVVVVITDITGLKLAEEKIRLHEAVLEETGRIAKIGGWTHDVATGSGYWTEEVARIHDLDPDTPTSKEVGLSYYQGESRRRIEAALEEAVQQGKSYDLELELTTAKGGRKWVRTIGHPIFENGKVVRLHGSFQDVSERHRLDEERERQQRRLALLADISQRLVLSDSPGAILQGIFADLSRELQVDIFANYMVSPAGDRLLLESSGGLTEQQQQDFAELPFGVSLCGLVAQRKERLVFADLPTVTVPQAAGIIALGVKAYAGHPLLAGNRLIGTISFGSRRLQSYSEEDVRLMRTVADQVSAAVERRRLHARLDESRAQLAIFIDHAPAALAMFDRDMRYLSVSRRWLTDYKLSREVIGRSHYEVLPEIDEAWKRVHRRALAGETVSADADRFNRADGTSLWLRWEVRPWYADTGVIGGIVVMSEDITARMNAEQAAGEATSLYRSLVDQMPVGVFRKDVEGRYVFVNDEFLRFTNTTEEDFLGRKVSDIAARLRQSVPGNGAAADLLEHATASLEHHDRIMQTGETIRLEEAWGQPDGSMRHLLAVKTPVYDGDRKIVGSQGVLLDITALKTAETAQRDSEERFRQMAESIEEVFWMTDTGKADILYVSPAYERIWGRDRDELYASPTQWLDAIVPEDRERVLEAARTKQATGEYREEYRIMRPDGTVRWIYDRAFPVKDSSGQVFRVVGAAQDITERKSLEAQFLRAQRLEAVGTLAGGVAHDLNNILAPVLMVTGLVRDNLTNPRDQELMTMVENSAKRGAAIIRQLLTFSRGVEGARISVQLRHLIKDMAHLMQETFPRNIEIRQAAPADLWTVTADATQMHQVLMNLCVNARDAMPEGGQLTLGAENLVLNGHSPRMPSETPPGPYVALTVTDTGTGIPAAVIDRIFEPFFTTKEIGKGTGLGLSTVMGIVKNHGGLVTVESQPGKGTSFRVLLPATDGENLPTTTRFEQPSGGRGELIMVVDDEQAVRDATCQNLERHNYVVLRASDGREAVGLFLQHQDSIGLVVTDLMMPVMGGSALIRALKTIKPELPIVATTGLDQEERVEEVAALGVRDVLRKPCTNSELLRTVRRALDA